MSRSLFASLITLMVEFAAVTCLSVLPVAAQTSAGGATATAASTTAAAPPHTAWGDPDLQGIWESVYGAPIEAARASDPSRQRKPSSRLE